MQGKKYEMLPYGYGCGLYSDCFNCPLPDCVWLEGTNKKAQDKLVALEKPYFERELNRGGGKGQ